MKYHGGITRGVFGGMTRRRKPVTCTDVARMAFVRGDVESPAEPVTVQGDPAQARLCRDGRGEH